jgi:uncharacterized protein (DUF1330 family)
MSAYLVARFTVKDGAALGTYSKAAAPIISSFGGELLFKCNAADALAGEPPLPGIAVFRFPDRTALKEFYNSGAYQALTEMRQAGADMMLSGHFAA